MTFLFFCKKLIFSAYKEIIAMKQFVLLIFSVLMYATTALAQLSGNDVDFDVDWGPKYNLPKEYSETHILSHPGKGYVRVERKQQKKLQFVRFSSPGMKMTDEKHYKMNDIGDKIALDKFVELNGTFYMFFSRWNEENKKERLFVKEIDPKDGDLKGERREILSGKKMVGDRWDGIGIFSFKRVNKYRFAFSRDSSRMLITYRRRPQKDEEEEEYDAIGFCMFNDNLRLQWAKEMKFPHNEDLMDKLDFSADSKGNAYMTAKIKAGEKEIVNGQPNYDYKAFKVSEDSDEIDELSLNVDGRFIDQTVFHENEKNNMIFTGYYSTRGPGYTVGGVVVKKVDQDFDLVFSKYNKFSKDILYKYEDKRTRKRLNRMAKNSEPEVQYLTLKNVQSFDDGSLLVAGEGDAVKSGNHFCYDIYLMKLSAEGKKQWTTKIPKYQQSVKSGYKYFNRNNKHYFLYIDHKENLEMKADEWPEKHLDTQGGYMTVCSVVKGEKEKAHLFNLREANVHIDPPMLTQLSSQLLAGTVTITRIGGNRKTIKLKYEGK